MAIKELDFRNEMANSERVRIGLEAAGLDVVVPAMIPTLCTERVLVMEFAEGFKVTDVAKLDHYGIDRESLMHRLCQAFAHQVYINGFFNWYGCRGCQTCCSTGALGGGAGAGAGQGAGLFALRPRPRTALFSSSAFPLTDVLALPVAATRIPATCWCRCCQTGAFARYCWTTACAVNCRTTSGWPLQR